MSSCVPFGHRLSSFPMLMANNELTEYRCSVLFLLPSSPPHPSIPIWTLSSRSSDGGFLSELWRVLYCRYFSFGLWFVYICRPSGKVRRVFCFSCSSLPISCSLSFAFIRLSVLGFMSFATKASKIYYVLRRNSANFKYFKVT